jgi:hypothetical protein
MTKRRNNVEGQRSLNAKLHKRIQEVTRPGPGYVCDSSSVELSSLTLPYLKGMLPNIEGMKASFAVCPGLLLQVSVVCDRNWICANFKNCCSLLRGEGTLWFAKSDLFTFRSGNPTTTFFVHIIVENTILKT